jgi:hypothetical protein
MRTRANPLFALQVLSVSDIVKPRRTNRPALAAAREPAELHAHSAHVPRSATMQAARSSTDDCQGPLQRLPRGASFDRSRRAPRVPGLPTAACGLLLCDTSGRIVAGNPHGLRLLQEAELRGHPLRRDRRTASSAYLMTTSLSSSGRPSILSRTIEPTRARPASWNCQRAAAFWQFCFPNHPHTAWLIAVPTTNTI